MVGTRLSYSDVMVGEVLTSYIECLPECLEPYPKLKALRETVVALPGVARYLSSELRWPKPDDDYKNNVNLVLRR